MFLVNESKLQFIIHTQHKTFVKLMIVRISSV
uniref:Uncharacterized protein n=1 Tax=Anguilla anguilla TaxID=7936 RepID=A0A0E9THN3_ANGAN